MSAEWDEMVAKFRADAMAERLATSPDRRAALEAWRKDVIDRALFGWSKLCDRPRRSRTSQCVCQN